MKHSSGKYNWTRSSGILKRLLVGKMSKFSIGPKTARWLYENIRPIRYYVHIGMEKSREYESKSEIVPGSILGPSLFIIFYK